MIVDRPMAFLARLWLRVDLDAIAEATDPADLHPDFASMLAALEAAEL